MRLQAIEMEVGEITVVLRLDIFTTDCLTAPYSPRRCVGEGTPLQRVEGSTGYANVSFISALYHLFICPKFAVVGAAASVGVEVTRAPFDIDLITIFWSTGS